MNSENHEEELAKCKKSLARCKIEIRNYLLNKQHSGNQLSDDDELLFSVIGDETFTNQDSLF